MDDLLNAETLELFLIFVVPGFVAMKVHDLIVPAPRRAWGDSLLEAISYSMINLALLFWFVGLLHRGDFPAQHPGLYGAGMFGFLVIAPVSWAILSRALRRTRWLRRFLLLPAPTAWDSFFERRQACWALCHLKSGKMIGGKMGSQSTASSFPHPEDLYIEEVWKLDDQTGEFLEEIKQTAGLLVRRDACSHIELFKKE